MQMSGVYLDVPCLQEKRTTMCSTLNVNNEQQNTIMREEDKMVNQ